MLKGQLVVRTVMAVTKVRIGADWTDGLSHSTFVSVMCCLWCELKVSLCISL